MGLSKTLEYRFDKLAEMQRQNLIKHCTGIARETLDPVAWVEALMQAVNTRLESVTEDSDVKQAAREQLDLIADELASKFTAVQKAA